MIFMASLLRVSTGETKTVKVIYQIFGKVKKIYIFLFQRRNTHDFYSNFYQ